MTQKKILLGLTQLVANPDLCKEIKKDIAKAIVAIADESPANHVSKEANSLINLVNCRWLFKKSVLEAVSGAIDFLRGHGEYRNRYQ